VKDRGLGATVLDDVRLQRLDDLVELAGEPRRERPGLE
jgi:hypothetical protein